MSYQIKIEFDDYTRRKNIGYLYLNTDKTISPYNRDLYPLSFKGLINGSSIAFILKNPNSDFIESYDFIDFPENSYLTKNEIIRLIHNHINKTMD